MSHLSPEEEQTVLMNAIEMQITPIGPHKHLKMMALSDKLKTLGHEISPEVLWSYFTKEFDIKGMEAATVEYENSASVFGDEDDNKMVESGQEDSLPVRSAIRSRKNFEAAHHSHLKRNSFTNLRK